MTNTVRGAVKLVFREYGCAFVALVDGRQIMLPGATLEGLSFADLLPGQWLECEIEEGEGCPEVVRALVLSA